MSVEWPDRRGDVLCALEVLASQPPGIDGDERDPRWPDLTNAVHWLVDDTGWDNHDPSQSVGTILATAEEAAAVRRVVELIVAVSGRQGATSSDIQWLMDEGWAEVQTEAIAAARLLRPG